MHYKMKQKLYTIITFLLFIGIKQISAQTSGKYEVGDMVNETILVYDTAVTSLNFTIPIKGAYVLVYRYRTVSIGKGFDNADSIKLLEEKISSILLGGMVANLRVICISYDRISDYNEWMDKIKKSKPFKPNGKYRVEYYNLSGNVTSEEKCRKMFSKLTMFGPDGRILRHSSSIAKFNYHLRDEKIRIKGKIVSNDNGTKVPLHEAFVHIQAGNKIDTLGTAYTDKYGDFEIRIPNNDTAYTIKTEPKNKETKSVILLTQEGKEISHFRKTFLKFEYKLLKADMLELSDVQMDEDLSLSFRKFEVSKQNELMVIENIIYGLQKFNIEKESEDKLMEVSRILKRNPNVKLEIISHTDSQGDDGSNLTLSKKRAEAVAEFLIKSGIEEKRISTKGKGETDIRNRCTNGVQCSDKEHAYNRRTEFNFIK